MEMAYCQGSFGLFPANSNTADEIEIYADENRKEPVHKFISLRQQGKKAKENPILL